MQFDIVFADASGGTRTFHIVNVHADFAGKTSNMRRRRNGFAMLGACNFAELSRHGECWFRLSRRSIRRERLFLGLPFCLHRQLEPDASGLLSGDVLDGCSLSFWRCSRRRSATLESEDDLADFDLLAFLYFDLAHNTGHG